jgi:uncharacterized protein YheU (UPF0270 family)
MNETPDPLAPVQIPMDLVSDEALVGIIDNYIQREGTDYGAHEISLERKRDQIRNQLQRGQIVIAFDPGTESVTLLTLNDWQKRPTVR